MFITQGKFTWFVWIEYNHEEIKYIDERHKQYNSLPLWVCDDLALWLSHCINKYWLVYNEVLSLTRYEVGRTIERLVLLRVAD